MKNRKWLVVFLVAVLLAGFSSGALAFQFGWQKTNGADAGEIADKMAENLELTSEQKDKLATAIKKVNEEVKAYAEKNKGLREKMKEELAKDTPNKNIIHNSIKEMNQNQAQIQIKRMDQMLEFRKSLTPEQQKKFKEMDSKRQGKKGSRGKQKKGL